MKKVTLINPSSKEFLSGAGDRPPLGLLYIASTLEKNDHKVKVRDLDHMSLTSLNAELEADEVDYVGVSAYTSASYNEACLISNAIGDKCKKVVGGHHATALPESLLPYYDAVVQREGEHAMLNIVENDLKGIVDGGMMSAEDIPKPARHLINLNQYEMKQDGKPTMTLVSSRGCPNSCCFCSNQTRQVRYSPVENVMEEIDDMINLGYKSFYFYDDCFTANKKRATELTDRLKTKEVKYRITTRAKSLNEDLVNKLVDSGCTWVSLGIESGSDERLRDVGKNMSTYDNFKAVEMLTKVGIKTKGFFMFGLPNETAKDAQKTIDFALYLKDEGLTTADFYILTPFPGTPIWNNPEKYGIEIIDRNYTNYLEAGKKPPKAFHKTKDLSASDIEYFRSKMEYKWKR